MLQEHGAPTDEVAVLAIRGYYSYSFGGPGNDRKVYDDCLCIVSPTMFATFNANTDPGAFRYGIATLKAGIVYQYKVGMHGLSKPLHPSGTVEFTSSKYQYEAFVQAGPVVVYRDDTLGYKAGTTHPQFGYCEGNGFWKGHFGINIHCGSVNSVSSLGCQTLPPAKQWSAFRSALKGELRRHNQKKFSFLVVEAAG